MQKLQLSISEPCHENWHNMTPTEQGRFCNACAKEVGKQWNYLGDYLNIFNNKNQLISKASFIVQ